MDGHRASLTANTIAKNMFAQIDDEGNRFILMKSIVDHRTDGSEVKGDDAYIYSKNGGKRRWETTKGWEILIQWKDGSTTWERMKDIKQCYPLQLAEYALTHNIADKPAFSWWVGFVLKKKNAIISKVSLKYWQRTHKFGIRIPKSIEEAHRIDIKNGNFLWIDAIQQEMKNVRIAFERFEGTEDEIPPGYQRV